MHDSVTESLNPAADLDQSAAEKSTDVPGPRSGSAPGSSRASGALGASDASGASDPRRSPAHDSDFLRAARREPVSRTPVWFMRQAGRALPEYKKVRTGIPMLDACLRPDLVTEITLQPVRRYGVDAAVLYSDIVVPLKAIGVEVEIVPNVGPVIAHPVRDLSGLDQIRPLDPATDLAFATEAVRQLVGELGSTPLIGFGGAPFTVASYLIEGGPSKNHEKTKAMMLGAPELFAALMDRLADLTAGFMRVQVEAGASVVQLFDSWAGALSPRDYERYVMPHSAKVLDSLADLGVPRIHFGVGTGELLPLMAAAGADVVGVDWRVPLDEASRRIGPDYAVQGNLDPSVMFAPWPVIETRVREVLDEGSRTPGHIFNLGHGVTPDMDPDRLARVVELVHEASAR
ncbi:uroporphyrinogen decarboxylase [Catenulispora acidiphila DSM 44928]|uniref:Uroporphyrinogen decarboxylase n=1 Tax=Catenulispora acidiphila (strain DSM 44928 / JCM 14897 / NBRC 102108 / NRRL B-24433 / ID139908) TaxID=479433 RepID=C7Q1S4_CATAD|nr:uroporphyrinogen decarboxylase [Catenulispora acidiphila DSM 44928]